ncbi:hypothetical protein [Oceanobacillus timonensis]|uniref:hypothetical protein n=1 Tax=Oceanobacillus timonensis TaxID=1926285 RepID=UPI0009BB7887|nr:hypothetical protein [Oceanobacillus timonensis]
MKKIFPPSIVFLQNLALIILFIIGLAGLILIQDIVFQIGSSGVIILSVLGLIMNLRYLINKRTDKGNK